MRGSKSIFERLVALLLSLLLCVSLYSCSSESSDDSETRRGSIISPNGQTISEEIIHESVIVEDTISEEIIKELKLEEIYLRELAVCEEKITEQLLQEDRIEEVLLCQTYYISQENIDEFSESSQIEALFAEKINLKAVLTKIAIGTGVIVTLTALRIANLDNIVGSVVAAAAPEALKSAAIGAGAGTLVGGLVGASEEVDESGITSAIVGFSLATAGLIISIVSLIVAIPSGGSSSVGVAAGVKIAIAGVSLVAAVIGEGIAAHNMVKTLQAADSKDIDWDNVDWNKVGEGAVIRSIEGASNGYMWGSIVGAVKGGTEGLEYYQKYHAPYSPYDARIQQTPVKGGYWTGKRGESTFVLDEPITLKDGTIVTEMIYRNGIPDFSHFSKAKISIITMTNDRQSNFSQADEVLSEYWSKTRFQGHTWTARDIANYRSDNQLTWHEMNDLKTMQLVPTEINARFGHLGGVGEYNAMINQQGGFDFD